MQAELSGALSAMDETLLEMISLRAPLPDILQALSQNVEAKSPETLCSIALFSRDGKGLQHVAAPSLPASYLAALNGEAAGLYESLFANSARRAQPIIVSDIASDVLRTNHRESALRHGLRAFWAMPVISKEGELLGTLGLYHREPRSPTPDDLAMMESAARLAAVAIGWNRSEEALREVEKKYRSIVDNAVEGFFQTTTEGAYVSVNPALARMYGYESPDQLMDAVKDIGREVYVDPARRAEFCRRIENQGIVQDFEYEVRRKDGRRIWLLENARAVRSANGEVLYYEGTVQDITQRKRAVAALAESEERFRQLFDDGPVACHEIDSDGFVRRVNRAECALLGYESSEILGKHASDFVAAEEREKSREAVQAKIRGEIPLLPFQREFTRADGSRILVEIHENLIRDTKGAIVGIRSAWLDITERKQLEEQLRQALKMEAVGRLAGGIAHDFNNLLMVIRGHSELLVHRLLQDENLCKNAKEIEKAAERAAALTRQLLAFSRMQTLQPKILDLNAVVADMSKMLDRVMGENIELIVKLGASLRGIKADQGQIEQVILNLAVNARDAIQPVPGDGKVVIETTNVTLDEAYGRGHTGVKPGKYVMLAVSDNGVGMDAETQAHIFEPFFTTKPMGKGTGLGLATVYGVVKQSSGWIWVYSEVGKGTTFKIYLPQAEGLETTAAPDGDIEAASSRQGSETILLVEDQEAIRDLVRDFLESRGYKVFEAQDGSEALEIVEACRPAIDLLLTDVVMPKMSGPQLANRLTGFLPDLKVLYISGHDEHAPAVAEPGSGNISRLQKPFALEELERNIRLLLDAGQSVVAPSTKRS